MDLERSEDQEFFRDTTRKFLESEVPLETVRKLADGVTTFEEVVRVTADTE